jgi:hypothetical protein
MTIAATYLVSDGVVLGADSSTTVQVFKPERTDVVQLLSHSQKVFEVGEKSRMGICTWGAGSLGNISHRTIVAQLADKTTDRTTLKEASEILVGIVSPLIKGREIPFVGYYLGGWNKGNHEPACFHIEITPKENKVFPIELGLCSFSGNPIFFSRVFWGFDQTLRDKLREELKKSINVEKFDTVFEEAFIKASAGLASIGFQDLPIREAVDFIYSYLHITVKAEKFKFGSPSCGGPIEVGFISTDRRFRWVRHKAFSSAITEQAGGEYECE